MFPSIEACAERIRAAVEVAKALPFDFTITARADNFFRGNTDLDDTIARLLAYGDAGADVVYAPAVVKPDAIKAIVGATKKPVNVLAGIGGNKLTVNDYKEIGVRRITIGSALWAVAYQAAKDAATTLLNDGSFEGFDNRMAYVDALKLYS
ncbi:MAG: isocitrate lyase/PEP mutase family protein [Pseudomonadota bacterium]